jgi:hypothetical protein
VTSGSCNNICAGLQGRNQERNRDLQISYDKIKRRQLKGEAKLNDIPRCQPTLESFGFHICDKISGSPAHTKLASDTLDSRIPTCYPFVKWAGGKRQIVSQLYALAPLKFGKYFEPFLGGGALFLHLTSDKSR